MTGHVSIKVFAGISVEAKTPLPVARLRIEGQKDRSKVVVGERDVHDSKEGFSLMMIERRATVFRYTYCGRNMSPTFWRI